ncbi:hypothetical protein PGTUg99_020399 [Puccinia graminis f. sp. tritici]|uniref:Uncharacterized protein n=2 Tax=Puccinia graminis f. sp. tritici TaxID=56615 RepID=A0A5B0NY99_PUCGR|nr:hypothetical protein PGTUg99_024379 [Puccinia graminis f. sp. tritici]KAA1131167.1 hypothetical protein PGTUg99_020399 [Puccinia graminis f. sp. tritici]
MDPSHQPMRHRPLRSQPLLISQKPHSPSTTSVSFESRVLLLPVRISLPSTVRRQIGPHQLSIYRSSLNHHQFQWCVSEQDENQRAYCRYKKRR